MRARPVIAVTGGSGVGKTEFSRRSARLLDLRIVNIGDLLLAELTAVGIRLERRSEIGMVFFRHFSLDHYLDLIRISGKPGTILDGIRMVQAIIALRELDEDLVHVHRTSALGCGVRREVYDSALPRLERMCDWVFPRIYPLATMDEVITCQLRISPTSPAITSLANHVDLYPRKQPSNSLLVIENAHNDEKAEAIDRQ